MKQDADRCSTTKAAAALIAFRRGDTTDLAYLGAYLEASELIAARNARKRRRG